MALRDTRRVTSPWCSAQAGRLRHRTERSAQAGRLRHRAERSAQAGRPRHRAASLLPACVLACALVPSLAGADDAVTQQEGTPALARARSAVATLDIRDGMGATIARGVGFFIDIGRIVVPRSLLAGARDATVIVAGKEQKVTAVLAEDRQARVVLLAVDLPDGAPPSLSPAAAAAADATPARAIGPDGTAREVVVTAAMDVPGLGLVQPVEDARALENGNPVVNARGELIGAAISTDVGDGERLAFVVPASRLAAMRRIRPVPLLDWSLEARAPRAREAELWVLRGDAAALARRFDEAEKAYAAATNLDPSDADAWLALGTCARARKRADAAIDAWRRAVAAQPDNARFHHELAVDLSDAGRYADAAAEFAEVSRLRPNDAEAKFNEGATLGAVGRRQEEYKAYKAALAIDPAHVRALKNLGLTCLQMQLFDEAVTAFTKAEKLAPADPEIETGLGVSYFRSSNIDAAVNALKRALQLAPTFVKAHFSLGAIYAAIGNHSAARQECQALRTLDKAKGEQLCKIVDGK